MPELGGILSPAVIDTAMLFVDEKAADGARSSIAVFVSAPGCEIHIPVV